MVQFADLWYRHPANLATQYPCIAPQATKDVSGTPIAQGFPVYGNQCAIRMGVCLKHAGVDLGLFRGLDTCGVHGPEEMHIIRAQDLADALVRLNIPGIGKVERITGTAAKDFYPKLIGRTGIIYIKDYWRRAKETEATGDHIDVWNGYRSSTKWLMEWFSWAGYYSNYAEAKEIWFWDVK
jgi:Type VI secretion system (T6SS), amidase effector protein 4